MPIFDEKYIKAKIREFNGEFITNVLVNEIPNKSMYYTCMAWDWKKRITHKFI